DIVPRAEASVVRVCDTPADREPKACPVCLRGDEGIEDLRQEIRKNSTTCVGDFDEQRGPADFAEIRDSHGQLSAWFHCFDSIQAQVEEQLLELRRVAQDRTRDAICDTP